jgi:hypothetical protein
VEQDLFGATVLHRRKPFADQALDRRTIFIRTRADHSRRYEELKPGDPYLEYGREFANLTFPLPEVEPVPDVTSGIFDTYYPLLAVAQLVGDNDFQEQIFVEMFARTERLKADQQEEPEGLVLKALIEIVLGREGEEGKGFGNVRCSDVRNRIWDNWRIGYAPRQVAGLGRDLGFETCESHGMTVIVVTPDKLLHVCTEFGSSDRAVKLLAQVYGKRVEQGGEGGHIAYIG